MRRYPWIRSARRPWPAPSAAAAASRPTLRRPALAVRVRSEASRAGEVGRALSEGRLIKTWAIRGALHLVTPEEAGAVLSLTAAGRSWERTSWRRYFGVTPMQLDVLRHADGEAVDGTVLTPGRTGGRGHCTANPAARGATLAELRPVRAGSRDRGRPRHASGATSCSCKQSGWTRLLPVGTRPKSLPEPWHFLDRSLKVPSVGSTCGAGETRRSREESWIAL
jgi:winged helix DNA-binding protein